MTVPMNKDEILEILVQYIRETTLNHDQKSEIPLNQSLLEIGILDSYGVIELVEFIEKNWGITINDHDLTEENFKGLSRTAHFIERKLGA